MNGLASEASARASPPDPQAQVLATLLRRERISLLLGTAPADRGWADSVLPLLCRRAVDRAMVTDEAYGPRRPRGAERRRATSSSGGDIELVVRVDHWAPAPLQRWRSGIEDALAQQGVDGTLGDGPLAEALPALSRQFGLRFLFLFDRFDACLAAPAHDAQARAFADEWVQALARGGDSAHFMLGLDDEADELLRRFRHRIPGLGERWLRLDSRDDSREGGNTPSAPDAEPAGQPRLNEAEWSAWIAGMLDRVSQAARPGAAGDGLAGPALRTAQVYESVEAMLARVAAANRAPPWQVSQDPADLLTPAPPRVLTGPPAAAAVHPPSPTVVTAPSAAVSAKVAAPARADWPMSGVGWGVALALVAFLGVLALSSTEPRAPAVPSDTPVQPRSMEGPRLRVQVDAEADTARRAVADLARSAGAAAGLQLLSMAAPDWDAAWAGRSPDPPAPLALLRHEALLAAQAQAVPPPLQIVAPLFTETIRVLVRADSALRHLHQIEGQRIDVGPASGARALTAEAVYRRLFDRSLPASVGHDGRDAALRGLREGHIDVLFWVEAGPYEAVAGMRPLALDPGQASTRRLLRDFLPASLDTPEGPVRTLASRLFLVAPRPLTGPELEQVGRLAGALCEAVPQLQRDGQPLWRQFQPGLNLPLAWPTLPEARQALSACAGHSGSPPSGNVLPSPPMAPPGSAPSAQNHPSGA